MPDVFLDTMALSPKLSEASSVAREAERFGFGALWFTESRHNPFLASAVSAPVTDKLGLGTAIALAFPRSPMVTAQVAWDLAQLSSGRFTLGLGTQVKAHIERRFSVPFSHPVARIREYVLALRAIFDAFQGEARLDFRGDYYSLTLLPDAFSGGPQGFPDVPVFLGGVNTEMAKVAGEVADGLHVHPFHTERYLNEVLLPSVAAGSELGERRRKFTITVPVLYAGLEGNDPVDEERIAYLRGQIAFYGSTPNYRSVLELHGMESLADELRRFQRQGEIKKMREAVSNDVLNLVAVIAPWDELPNALAERYQGKADRLALYGAPEQWRARPELGARFAAVTRQFSTM